MTTRALPRSLEDLRGRRAARWIRESTAGQADNFGPDAQLEQQTRAIERWGLLDTGGAWQVAHSGRTIAATEQWAGGAGLPTAHPDDIHADFEDRVQRWEVRRRPPTSSGGGNAGPISTPHTRPRRFL